MANTIEYEIESEKGIEIIEVPTRRIVCPNCNGQGTVLRASMRHHAYSAEELETWTDEEREQYLAPGGCYDETCPECKGKNVIDVMDLSTLRRGDARKIQENEAKIAREKRAELSTLRMESGWLD